MISDKAGPVKEKGTTHLNPYTAEEILRLKNSVSELKWPEIEIHPTSKEIKRMFDTIEFLTVRNQNLELRMAQIAEALNIQESVK